MKEPKINSKTNFVDRVNLYHKIVKVKSEKEFKRKYGYLEHGLGSCLEIFFEKKFQGGNKNKELKIYEIKGGKKLGQPFKCDWYANIGGKDIVFEFNGNHHYQSSFKIFAASITSFNSGPLPRSLILGSFVECSLYMPLIISSSTPFGIGGCA